MKLKHKIGLGVAALAIAIPTVLFGAGNWSNWVVVGGPSYCSSYVTGTNLQGDPSTTPGTVAVICGQTVPAGPPALTGSELIPLDLNGGNVGSPVQSAVIPVNLLQFQTNKIIGGDFSTNLAQRLNTAKGVTALATLSPTAAVITADRWWAIAPAAGVTVTIDSTAATAVVPALNNTKAMRVARTTSGAAGIVCTGQTLDAAASAPLIGNNAILSFWEFNGSTQSATNGNITVNVDYSSAADTAGTQATLGFAGGNGSLFALGDVGLLSAGPTNMTRAIAGLSPGTTGTVAAGVATIPASTTWTRYGVYAPIPVNIPGTTTAVTNVSISICWTPIATTAVTTDYIELEGVQLEARSSTVTTALPAGVVSPTAFERRLASLEQTMQEYYLYFNYENQSLVSAVPNASCTTTTSTTAGMCSLAFPVPMRIVPAVKYTAGFQAFTSTAYTTLGAMAANATYSNTLVTVPATNGVMFSFTASTLPAVGTVNYMMNLGTSSATGIISASAEP